MTDNTTDPGSTPENGATPKSNDEAESFAVDASGQTTPRGDKTVTPVPAEATADDTARVDADVHSPAPVQPSDAPSPAAEHAVVANATPENAAAENATAEYPTAENASAENATAAYPTDAFGRPITSNDSAAPSASAHDSDAVAPSVAADSTKRRRNVGLVAALAIAAIVGGASGAGIYALVDSGRGSTIPSSQSQGANTVVVNNTDSVNEITAVAAKATPSVVTISVSGGQDGGTGSGVILSEDGYVLTNTHVVTLDGAVGDAAIQVKGSDGTLSAATLVGTDPISDLAVIKMTDAQGLSPIAWADSAKLNVGDTAIAIGAPLGLSGTVTNGIVSALNRSITVASSAAPATPDQVAPNEGSPFDFWNFPNQDGTQPQQEQPQTQQKGSISLPVIQTDAAINPGNSGGALLNGKGELIGINVAIANAGGSNSSAAAGNIGVGFSIPSNFAERISNEIIANGKATHGLLGASVTSAATDTTSTTVGALISEVSPGGAAEKAGLRKGDIVTNFAGVPITDANDLTAQVRVLPAGGTADLTYVRGGQSTTVSVTVGELTV